MSSVNIDLSGFRVFLRPPNHLLPFPFFFFRPPHIRDSLFAETELELRGEISKRSFFSLSFIHTYLWFSLSSLLHTQPKW